MAIDNSYIINHPNISEKYSSEEGVRGRVSFSVRVHANKHQIKEAAQELFGVKVKKVSTMIQIGKNKRVGKSSGRSSTWKRAIVTFEKEVDVNNIVGLASQE